MILREVFLLSVINEEIVTAVPGHGLLQWLYHILMYVFLLQELSMYL